jgi:hypothetical protein
MSLAQKVAASRRLAREQEEAKKREELAKASMPITKDTQNIATAIVKAKQANKVAFPSDEIESLVELAYRQVAKNFSMFPEL